MQWKSSVKLTENCLKRISEEKALYDVHVNLTKFLHIFVNFTKNCTNSPQSKFGASTKRSKWYFCLKTHQIWFHVKNSQISTHCTLLSNLINSIPIHRFYRKGWTTESSSILQRLKKRRSVKANSIEAKSLLVTNLH